MWQSVQNQTNEMTYKARINSMANRTGLLHEFTVLSNEGTEQMIFLF